MPIIVRSENRTVPCKDKVDIETKSGLLVGKQINHLNNEPPKYKHVVPKTYSVTKTTVTKDVSLQGLVAVEIKENSAMDANSFNRFAKNRQRFNGHLATTPEGSVSNPVTMDTRVAKDKTHAKGYGNNAQNITSVGNDHTVSNGLNSNRNVAKDRCVTKDTVVTKGTTVANDTTVAKGNAMEAEEEEDKSWQPGYVKNLVQFFGKLSRKPSIRGPKPKGTLQTLISSPTVTRVE